MKSQAEPRSRRGWLRRLRARARGARWRVLRDTRPARRGRRADSVKATRVQAAGGAAASSGTAVLTASGYLVARREAVVSAKIQGRLSELRVEEGSVVREGDVLARLESADYEAQLARARAQRRAGRTPSTRAPKPPLRAPRPTSSEDAAPASPGRSAQQGSGRRPRRARGRAEPRARERSRARTVARRPTAGRCRSRARSGRSAVTPRRSSPTR